MRYEYLAQDEYDIIDQHTEDENRKYKEPIEITIKITIEKRRYESIKKRRKTPIATIIKDIFKATK